jgi:tetratricopeptide (TPR) repeat protein
MRALMPGENQYLVQAKYLGCSGSTRRGLALRLELRQTAPNSSSADEDWRSRRSKERGTAFPVDEPLSVQGLRSLNSYPNLLPLTEPTAQILTGLARTWADFNSMQCGGRQRVFKVIGWTIVLAFIATTTVTLLAIVGLVRVEEQYLNRLFAVLVIEVVAAGFFLFRQGLNPEQRYFRQANELFQEAKAARAEGKAEEADQFLGRILRLSPEGLPFDVRHVFRERGEIASARSDWDASVRSHAVYLEIQPDDVEALVRYGRALRETGRYQVALQTYENAQRLEPSNYDVLNGLQNSTRRLGAFALDADRPDVADGYFQRTRTLINSMLTLAPSREKHEKRYLNALLARARLQWEWRRYPEAVAAYEQVQAEFPERADIREDLAAVLLELGEREGDQVRLSRSRDMYRELLRQREPTSSSVFIGAGFAEAAALAADTTRELLEEAERAVLLSIAELAKELEDPYPHYAAAVLAKRMGREDRAINYLRNAIRHERQRASDPFRFDYVRLVKYERLLQGWGG